MLAAEEYKEKKMSFISRINTASQRFNNKLKKVADNRKAAIARKAERDRAQAQTANARSRIRAAEIREKARVDMELAEAKRSANRAAVALKKAKAEAGDVGFMGSLRNVQSMFKPKKRVVKRRTTKRVTKKAVAKKRKTTRRPTRRYKVVTYY